MDKVQLLDDLAKSFSTSELAELCMSLEVDYEELGSGGKRSQARELIGYMDRRGRLPEPVQRQGASSNIGQPRGRSEGAAIQGDASGELAGISITCLLSAKLDGSVAGGN